MAPINSNGTGGGNWDVGASWVGGVSPGVLDDVTVVAGDLITMTQPESCKSINVSNGNGRLNYGAFVLTVAGDIIINADANDLIGTGKWIQSANGNIYNPLYQNTLTELEIAAGVAATLTGNFFGNKITLRAGCSVAFGNFDFVAFITVNDFWYQEAGVTFTTGTGGLFFNLNGNFTQNSGANMSLDATCIPVTIKPNSNVADRKLTWNADFSSCDLIQRAGNGHYMEIVWGGSLDITGNYRWGSNTGAGNTGYSKIDFNGSTLDISGNFYREGASALNTINYSNCVINIGGNIDHTGATVAPGTGTLTANGAGAQILTSAGQSMPNLLITKTGGTITFADAIICLSYTHVSGTVNRAGFNITTTNNYVVGVAAIITAAGLVGSITTVGGQYLVTGTALNIHNLNPAGAWTLNVTGTSAVSYANVSNSDASGGATITADDNTCNDLLNNTNWDFFLAGIEVMANMGLEIGVGLT
jgi:hypothetical protein